MQKLRANKRGDDQRRNAVRKMRAALGGKATAPFTAAVLSRLTEPELMQLRSAAPPGISSSTRNSAAG